jgi:hypothetical protein
MWIALPPRLAYNAPSATKGRSFAVFARLFHASRDGRYQRLTPQDAYLLNPATSLQRRRLREQLGDAIGDRLGGNFIE